MANHGVEEERERNDQIASMGKKAFDAKQKKSGDKVKKAKERLAKNISPEKGHDSLAHLKDPKTGYYDLKLHSKSNKLPKGMTKLHHNELGPLVD